jgi:hypothetical protein
MSERQESPYDSTARRWLALVERRQQNFIDLCNTGRWQHYYTHAQFLDEMRKMLDLRNRWALMAGLPAAEQIAIRHSSKQNEQPNPDSGKLELRPHRMAARRPGLDPRQRSWPPFRCRFEALDLTRPSPYPGALSPIFTIQNSAARA